MYFNATLSICPTLSFPYCVHKYCSLCLCLCSCPANRFISTIFLGSICTHSYAILVFFFLTYFTLYVTRTDSNVFLFMTEQYSIVHIYHNFFIHSYVDRHLGCFPALAIINSAADEHWGTCVLFNCGFLRVYAWWWDCWVIW